MKEKPNVSNQFINAKYNYSPIEIDLMLHLVARLDVNNQQQYSVVVTFKDILTEKHRHAGLPYLKRACNELLRKPYEIWDGNKYWLTNLFHTVTVDPKKQEVCMTVGPAMRAIILDIKKEFTPLNIKNLLNLDGKHSKRIYMLAYQFLRAGNRTMQLDELKTILGVNYPVFKDFKERVLQPAIAEINEKTDIIVTNNFEKIGKKIERLQWSINVKNPIILASNIPNEPLAPVSSVDSNKRNFLRSRLLQYGVKDWFIQNIFATLEPNEIGSVLHKLSASKYPVSNAAAYLWKSFVNLGVPKDKIERTYTLDELGPELQALTNKLSNQ